MRITIISLTILLMSACFARGGVSGARVEHLDAVVAQVHEAVMATLQAEEIAIEEESVDRQASLVKGRYADGVRVTIHATRFSERVTRITIQVGSFGDAQRSGLLMDGIQGRLPGS